MGVGRVFKPEPISIVSDSSRERRRLEWEKREKKTQIL